MATYYNKLNQPITVMLRSGSNHTIPPKGWAVFRNNDDGTASIVDQIRKGHLVRTSKDGAPADTTPKFDYTKMATAFAKAFVKELKASGLVMAPQAQPIVMQGVPGTLAAAEMEASRGISPVEIDDTVIDVGVSSKGITKGDEAASLSAESEVTDDAASSAISKLRALKKKE